MVALKNRSTTNNVLSVFFVAAPKSRSVYSGPRSTIHFSGPHNKYLTLIPCIFIPANETWMLKVGVVIKLVVFRTLCCVVARIALATDYCCCLSIRSAPRRRERRCVLSKTSEKRAKKCFLNGTLQLFFGSWCMERLINTTWQDCFQIGVIFCAKTNNNITIRKSPWYCGRYHSAFIYWISVGTRTYIHGYRRGKRAHDWNEEEVVVITITAPEKATQQRCEWLRPRGLGASRVVLCKFGQIHMVCTLVQLI